MLTIESPSGLIVGRGAVTLKQAVGSSDRAQVARSVPLRARLWRRHKTLPDVVAPQPAGLALSLLLAGLVCAGGSGAVTLGELQVGSTLGQPFAGVVRVDAAAGELIRRECFSPGPDFAAIPGVPRIEDASFRLETSGSESLLRIASRTPVREPLTQVILQMKCPGLPSLARSFLVLLDPSSVVAATGFVAIEKGTVGKTATALAPRRNLSGPGSSIMAGSRYTVRAGDTLSGIASRIADRPAYSVWPLAERLHAANPDAFENGRPDKLIAGSSLTIPSRETIAASGGLRSVPGQSATRVAARARPAAASPPAQAYARSAPATPTRELPVVIGTPLNPRAAATGVALEYLVLTPALSNLSRSRIRQRATKVATTSAPAPAPAVTPVVEAPVVKPAPEEEWSSKWWWALLLGALTMILAVLSLFFFRLRKPVEAGDVDESPWNVDEVAPAGQEMVYDDFEGTFVPRYPENLKIPGKDPEEDIQTHLMPAQGEARPAAPIEQAGAADAFPEFPGTGVDQEPAKISVQRPPVETPGTIVETFEVAEDEMEGDGWVDLDFEATQILEQDYLAEYAATLKERVKAQSGAHRSLDETGSGPDDSEVLLEASDLMDALDDEDEDDPLSADGDADATSEMPFAQDEPLTDDETLTLTLEDNVVAIDSGKKLLLDDGDGHDDKKLKDSTKKT